MSYKRILTIQDISCIGQCSMTVALPILSACGHETVILPTAVLSTQTGVFEKPHIRDLTADIPGICEHWRREEMDFDFIYSGYLGSIREIGCVQQILDTMLAPGGKSIVDPAMADHGKFYSGFDEQYAAEMKKLCQRADVIIPNITEAAIMTGLPYREAYDEDYIRKLAEGMEAECVVLTGVSCGPEQTGIAVYQKGELSFYSHKRIPGRYHGTGDIFASVLVGALAGDREFFQAARIAADFTCRCIENTFKAPAHRYGVKFEPVLPELIRMLE